MSQKEIVGLDCGELLLSVKYGIVFDKSNFVLSSESAISGRDVNTIVNNRFEYNVKWDDGKSPDSIVTMSAPNFVVGNNLALISADVKLKNGETKQFDEFALVNTSTKCEFFVNSIDQPQRGNVILIDSEKKQFNSLRDFVVSPESSRGDGFEAISLLVGAVLGVVLGLLDVFHKGKGVGVFLGLFLCLSAAGLFSRIFAYVTGMNGNTSLYLENFDKKFADFVTKLKFLPQKAKFPL